MDERLEPTQPILVLRPVRSRESHVDGLCTTEIASPKARHHFVQPGHNLRCQIADVELREHNLFTLLNLLQLLLLHLQTKRQVSAIALFRTPFDMSTYHSERKSLEVAHKVVERVYNREVLRTDILSAARHDVRWKPAGLRSNR